MTTGWYISGAAHLALIVFLMLGGLFTRDRFPEVAVTEVSLVSEEEYAALVLRAPAPEVNDAVPAPEAPETDAAPEMPTTDAAPAVAVPDQTEEPDAPEAPPEAPQIVVPDAEVTTDAPVIAPPTVEDGDTVAPQSTPAPAPRVAPDPTPMPDVQAETAPEVVEQTAPEPAPEQPPVLEEQDPAAPDAATTRIITEADRPDELAPVESIRPRSRPPRPVRTAEPAPVPQQETPPAPQDNAVNDAVAAALADANRPAAPATPTGPPMTDGEKDALRVAVQACWNVGSLSTDALRTTVTVAVSMARDGRPDTGSIRMMGFEGGSEASARQAYEAARRAIIRCGASGFALPVEKYDHWRDIEMVFNPERMRIR